MGQLVGCIQGIGAACAALGTPVVSGNVSLYNETDGQPILPTPTIGAVGLLETPAALIGQQAQAGDAVVLIGAEGTHLGASAFAQEVMRDAGGDAPPVDLEAEKAAGATVLALRDAGLLHAAQDLSDGGLALAAVEMAFTSNTGIALQGHDLATLFGENQARYIVAVPQDAVPQVVKSATQHGSVAAQVGTFEGDSITLAGETRRLDDMRALHAGALSAIVS
ncbi:MAG: AIR synthase-related protein, partial [Pseudomonadota bacterium]